MIDGWGPQDRAGLIPVSGGVTAAEGFRAAGATSGVKPSGKPDLAVVTSDAPVAAAALTTTNRVKASSCLLTDRNTADGQAQAIVFNSGNANVCTPDGAAHTDQLAASAAALLNADAADTLVMSTGVIGVPLPVDKIERALPSVIEALATDGGDQAAEAILTTDTQAKQVAFTVRDDQGECVIGGMAKGVGMIEPAMATLLVAITTDAPIVAALLKQMLRSAVGSTFNRISVDGDGSTSDSIALLASGKAPQPPRIDTIERALHAVCADLAQMVVADGEGASRVAAITVRGAPTEQEAERLARAVATSLLVRAAIHGADPNWGRILMALGGAGVDFEPSRVHVSIAGNTVCRFGVATAFDAGQVSTAMQHDQIDIDINLAAGEAGATMLTCDLTPEYVRFNAEYTT